MIAAKCSLLLAQARGLTRLLHPIQLPGKTASAAVLAATLLAGCLESDFPACRGPVATHALGKCVASYHQADYGSGGQVTQALVECDGLPSRPGGNVVAIHSVAHGIGLRWLDPHTLEVAVPAGAELQDQRRSDRYSGYPLRYVYRELRAGEPALQGCGLVRSNGD